jgi:hypothetical protein
MYARPTFKCPLGSAMAKLTSDLMGIYRIRQILVIIVSYNI